MEVEIRIGFCDCALCEAHRAWMAALVKQIQDRVDREIMEALDASTFEGTASCEGRPPGLCGPWGNA